MTIRLTYWQIDQIQLARYFHELTNLRDSGSIDDENGVVSDSKFQGGD